VFSHSALHPHPARLRIVVGYFDADCNPRVDVPPESIWVTFSGFTSTLKVNDLAAQTYADDSTDAGGAARITVSSFSGSGSVKVKLFVSGVSQGTKTVRVRTVDTNADGRFDEDDISGLADINYDGAPGSSGHEQDVADAAPHDLHWHRNALHGTLVRRTNLCETCPDFGAGTKGEGQVFWSPSHRFISFSAFVDTPDLDCAPACKIFIVPSVPGDGNALTQVTSQPACYHDYDPSWSPLNDKLIFDRADSVVIAVDLPWLGSAETAITASNNAGCGSRHGDGYPAISPDGQWVAFSRCNTQPDEGGTGGWSLWKIPTSGGTAIQLTPAAAVADQYATWSPDGQTIYFQREDGPTGQISSWKVPAAGGTAEEVFVPSASPDIFDAVQPTSSPDGMILTLGYGKKDPLERNVATHTLNPAIASPEAGKLIPNYTDTTFAQKGDFPLLSPHLSPDGTRLALGSKQVWAARRNMNLPPAFTSWSLTEQGTHSISDTAATVGMLFDIGLANELTVSATDPEGDALTYHASFFPAWMSWNPGTRTLSGDPPPNTLGKTYYVKFWVTTPSGGTDSFIAVITVAITLGPSTLRRPTDEHRSIERSPNPTRGTFIVSAPAGSGRARLSIFDLAGRLVAKVDGPLGRPLVWEGKDRSGARAPSGVYLWRLEADHRSQEGRVVVVR
jgi:hypothetical protein